MRAWSIDRLVRWACILGLLGLAFMIWSVLSPRPYPVILAMSLGQALGTAGLVMYLVAVVADLRQAGLLGNHTPTSSSDVPPPAPPADNPTSPPPSSAPPPSPPRSSG